MPERVPLSVFVAFTLAHGVSRLAVVRAFKDQRHRRRDFFKPIREAIVGMHEKGRNDRVLDDFVLSLTDERQRRIFPDLCTGYRRFLTPGASHGDTAPPRASWPVWFSPPRSVLSIGDLDVDIAPDLGLTIDGTPHLLTCSFDGAALTKPRIAYTLALVTACFGPTRPGTVFAILDVPRGRVRPLTGTNPRMGLLLRAEAAAFGTIYAAI